MDRAGFSLEGSSNLPCARFLRGNLANNFFVISPKLWRVTVDTRIEVNSDGGSSVDACWMIQTVSQIVVYTETRYWRIAMSELQGAVERGEIGTKLAERAARFSALCLLLLIVLAFAAATVVGITMRHHGYGPVSIVTLMLAIILGALFAFRDWRGLRG